MPRSHRSRRPAHGALSRRADPGRRRRGAGSRRRHPGRLAIRALPDVRIEVVEPSPLLRLLEDDLDAGEAAALALAVSLHADLVLLDEARGRAVARKLGLAVLGTIGLLAMAKRRGLIPAARPLIDQVRIRGGLWVTDNLVAEVLARLGE